MNKKLSFFILCAFILFLLIALHGHFNDVSIADTSRYYYLAMARHHAQFGFIKTLPQTPELAWNNHFVDASPLFSLLSGLALRWGGENSVLHLCFAISFLLCVSLLWMITQCNRGIYAVALLFMVVATPDFAYPITTLGPKSLELILFTWGVWFFVKDKIRMGALCFFLLTLASPLLQLSLFFLGSFLLVALLRRKPSLKTLLLGFAAILVGLFLNPYFPGNLKEIPLHAFRALGQGSELLAAEAALRTDAFVHIYGFFLMLVIFSVYAVAKYRTPKEVKESDPALILMILSIISWIWTAYYRPAAVYAILTSFLLVIHCWPLFRMRGAKWGFTAILLLAFPSLMRFYQSKAIPTYFPRDYFAALDTIPREMAGKSIYNCNWDDGNLVFYHRPDLRVLDLYSPELLKRDSPESFDLRSQLNKSLELPKAALPSALIKGDFVLCDRSNMLRYLEKDPHYQRLFPIGWSTALGSHQPYLFARIEAMREAQN